MPVLSQDSPSAAERRIYPRFPAPVMVRYGAVAASTSGYAYDISEGGLGFAGDEPQPIGSEIRVRFKWDSPMGEWYDTRAIVRHVDGNKMGVQFLDLKESVKIKLVEMIYQEITRRRS
ncbi:MAG: PilZ domain-containing protein [Acidobacteriota bacterium]|nr:PilZ domain-containing protein [Acidobacteriota bacterium]